MQGMSDPPAGIRSRAELAASLSRRAQPVTATLPHGAGGRRASTETVTTSLRLLGPGPARARYAKKSQTSWMSTLARIRSQT
jgi:hypothetical protein